jgi:hypothetical protein
VWTSTVILTGTVVVEGTAFRWTVTDARAQQLTVSHPTVGTQTQLLRANPEAQARAVGRAMLKNAARAARIGYIDAVDDIPTADGDPDPTIV